MFLLKWDTIKGGVVWLQYPKDMEIDINVIQQIQISHNFIESYITIQEKDWNSLSYYNENEEVIIVLILDDYDDSRDYRVCVEEFNKNFSKDLSEAELIKNLENALNMKVFRTTDEVMAKLSHEWSTSKMRIHDIETTIKDMLDMDIVTVKTKIIFSLILNSELSLKEITRIANTSRRWTESVLNTLIKNKIIRYQSDKDTYTLGI